MGWIVWLILALLILIFNYSAGKNNEAYDSYVLQKGYFDTYVNNDSLIFARYIGEDRSEIDFNQYTLITVSTTDNDKIKVELDDVHILYDDFKHFNSNWRFKDGEIDY